MVEAVDMDLVDGDGKQQFTVEKSTLVDSFCGVEVTVLSLYQSFGTMKHEKTA